MRGLHWHLRMEHGYSMEEAFDEAGNAAQVDESYGRSE